MLVGAETMGGMEEFDTEFMQKLFAHAYQMAREGYPWEKFPPGFSDGG